MTTSINWFKFNPSVPFPLLENIMNKIIALTISIALFLTGCGDGSGEGASVNNGPAITGRVIYDKPIAQAQVTIKDAAGHQWQATTDSAGWYRVDLGTEVTVKPPLIVHAVGTGQYWEIGNGATTNSIAQPNYTTLTPDLIPSEVDESKAIETQFSIYAASNSVGDIPVTPTTNLVVIQLTGNRAEAAFLNLGDPGTTIANALTPDLVQGAQTNIKEDLALLGLPATLVDDPAADSLVPVDLTSTYEKLVSGDVLSALVALNSALVDNAINFGCDGEAWGMMLDDGQRRPSCLPGLNIHMSHLVTNFKGVDSIRSTDVTARADELAGVNGPGGGWKYQSVRVDRTQRISNVKDKIVAAFKYYDSYGNLSGTANSALSWLATWSDTSWSNLNTRICNSVNAKDLSDLTYSYLELKRDMKYYAPAPKGDAAEGLILTNYSAGMRSVNRIVPLFFNDGINTGICPILDKQATAIRTQVAAYVPGPPCPALAGLVSDMYAKLDIWEALVQQGASSTDKQAALDSFVAAVSTLGGYYPNMGDLTKPSYDVVSTIVTCDVYGYTSSWCIAQTYTSAQFKADVDAMVSTVPADLAAGSTEETGATALDNLSTSIAQFLIDEYEQRFDGYFNNGVELYSAVEVQGYVVDPGLDIRERDAYIVVPDVSAVGYKVNDPWFELTGDFVMRGVDAHMAALDPNAPPAPRLLTDKILIDPSFLPAVASCVTTDEACMGQLRRTRAFTPLGSVTIFGIMDLLSCCWPTWEDTILFAVRNHEEVIPFRERPYHDLENLPPQ